MIYLRMVTAGLLMGMLKDSIIDDLAYVSGTFLVPYPCV